ncbi:hypothetical protein [Sphingopyxis sp.]|uniref:hypothetical protein n=1 Tax=Sphingopyxis sp. TaxID=1908224 RepID=UPI00262BBEBC|nr:hypothetical protein [Sphingopyxis sp.]MCW0200103.1 hypothetical protein [Sphingopyxis sp.]
MSVAGKYDTTVKSPMGDQKGVFTVVPADGGAFSGTVVDGMGTMEVVDGKIDGNTLTWKMSTKVPMPLDFDCEATIDGDSLSGKVKAGAFGEMTLSGTRQA